MSTSSHGSSGMRQLRPHTGRQRSLVIPRTPYFRICSSPISPKFSSTGLNSSLVNTILFAQPSPDQAGLPPLSESRVFYVHCGACAPRSQPKRQGMHGPLSTQESVYSLPTSTWASLTLAITEQARSICLHMDLYVLTPAPDDYIGVRSCHHNHRLASGILEPRHL